MPSRKERQKTLRLRCYNIVIQPADKQSPDNYIGLFRKFFALRLSVCVHRKSCLQFKSMDFADDFISGTVVKFELLPTDDWYNSETNAIEDVSLNPALHPGAREFRYCFQPSRHRLYLEAGVAVRQALTFVTTLISKASEVLGFDAVCNVVSTRESIDRIIQATRITSLIVRLSYSNGDNFDNWAGLIGNENKDSGIRSMTVEARGTKEHPILLDNNNLIKALLELSRSNGDAIATVLTDNGTEHVSTIDSPEQTDVKYTDDASLLTKLKHFLGLG